MKSDYLSDIRGKIGNMAMFYPCVGVVPVKEGKVLLQKRSDNAKWAIHGGGMEPGEKYSEALKRELKEELNIIPINPVLMGIYSGEQLFNKYPSGDEVFILNHVFICEEYEGDIKFNDGEVLEVKWFDIDDLPKDVFEVDKPILRDLKGFLDSKNVVVVD